MNEREPDFSRIGRKRRRNKSNSILNTMIAVVTILIIVVGVIIVFNMKDAKKVEQLSEKDSTIGVSKEGDQSKSKEKALKNKKTEKDANEDASDKSSEEVNGTQVSENPGKVTTLASEDEIVSESIVDTSWEPIGTAQTGEHVSVYAEGAIDYNEKKDALAYATGLPIKSMIFHRIKNGGGPQSAIGVVSTLDKKEKYRVYIEWVDGEGWKPIKKEVLTTLENSY